MKAGDVWKYTPSDFQDVSGNWHPSISSTGEYARVFALESHVQGCGSQSLRQVRYWSLPAMNKTFQFTVGQGRNSRREDTLVLGKVQFRNSANSSWSKPKKFSIRFGETPTIRLDAANAREILVSLYPDEKTCAGSDFTLVYFNDQVTFG